MRPHDLAAIVLMAAFASAGPAQASASQWHDAQGAKIRLVTTGVPDAQNHLRGALEIRLEPGWKTYWRDPGDAGVPPSLSAAIGPDSIGAELAFPAPSRFDDGYSIWAGYDAPVLLPVTFDLANAETSDPIAADVFLGVCETICIPVQAQLLVPMEAGRDAEHAKIVAAAFEALPEPESPRARAWVEGADADQLTVAAVAPAGAEIVDLFVASTGAHVFGTPKRIEGKPAFTIPILSSHPTFAVDEAHYTLVTSDGAVFGKLRLDK